MQYGGGGGGHERLTTRDTRASAQFNVRLERALRWFYTSRTIKGRLVPEACTSVWRLGLGVGWGVAGAHPGGCHRESLSGLTFGSAF